MLLQHLFDITVVQIPVLQTDNSLGVEVVSIEIYKGEALWKSDLHLEVLSALRRHYFFVFTACRINSLQARFLEILIDRSDD